MKITKEQYDKAKSSIPKLQKAQGIVSAWEDAVAGEKRDVLSINVTPEGTELTYKKEKQDAPRIHTA